MRSGAFEWGPANISLSTLLFCQKPLDSYDQYARFLAYPMRHASCIVPLALVISGCATRPPAAWRLTGNVLTPPGVPMATATQGTFVAAKTAALDACPRDAAVQLDTRKRQLKVTVDRGALEKQTKGWLADWSDRCFAPEVRPLMTMRVLEAVPLASGAGYRLMHGDDIHAGYIDLAPGFRLEVISPIVRPGTPEGEPLVQDAGVDGNDRSLNVTLKASPNLVGHETAWYRLTQKAEGGSRIAAVSAVATIRGIAMPLEEPGTNHFKFGADSGYYRLFFKPEQQRAVIVGVASRAALPLDTDSCGKPGGPECTTMPQHVGVNPYLEVSVNGKPLAVPAHMPPTVDAAIRAAKARTQDVLATLSIAKPYRGKLAPLMFDRTSRDVLGLVLSGDEEIRW